MNAPHSEGLHLITGVNPRFAVYDAAHQSSIFLEVIMAQTIDSLKHDTAVELEKVGVILGFLTGLVLAIGLLSEPLTSTSLPSWIGIAGVAAIVALCTRGGLAISRLFSRR
jgi:hypothetical protein